MASLNGTPDLDTMNSGLQHGVTALNIPYVDTMNILPNSGSIQTAPAGNITFVNSNVTFNRSQLNSIGGNFIQNPCADPNHDRTGNYRPIIPSTPPSAPQIFFGRDGYVNEAVQIIKTKSPARLAILGAGGIGKTSTALAILHHKETKAIFGKKRYFVSCESLTSSAELLDAMMQVFDLNYVPREHAIDSLHNFWDSSGQILLVLDNFETLWEGSGLHFGVRDILKRLSGTENITLIITMRGSLTPEGVIWHKPSVGSELQPLPLDAARDAFLTINPSAADEVAELHALNQLLQEMDCVPLAVTLLAHLSEIESCSHLLDRWNNEKIKLLSGVGQVRPHCLTSVEVSILISLNSSRVKDQKQAKEFLAMLSHLPDGIVQWEKTLKPMTKEFHQPEQIVQVLLGVSLIYKDSANGTLKMLSPIKHYILENYSLENEHLQVLREYYVWIIDQWKAHDYNPHMKTSYANILPQYRNIAEILTLSMNDNISESLAGNVLGFGYTLYLMGVSTQRLVEKLVELLNNQLQLDVAKTWYTMYKLKCQMLIVKILEMEYNYAEAKELLNEAQKQFSEGRDRLGQAQCLQSLGNILQMESKYSEARDKLEEAQRQFSEIGSRLGQAQCLQSLGNILQMKDKYSEARDKLEEAQRQFSEIGFRLGQAQCLQSLGNILQMEGKYPEAKDKLEEAQRWFSEIGSRLGQAQCLQSLGNILQMEDRYPEAREKLEEAQQWFSEIENQHGFNQCSYFLQQLYLQAEIKLLKKKNRLCSLTKVLTLIC